MCHSSCPARWDELAVYYEAMVDTIPIEIRKKLGIKEGSKVLFLEEAGRIYLTNSTMEALLEAQAAFAGEAERVGLKTEEDVVAMVKELRKERTVK